LLGGFVYQQASYLNVTVNGTGFGALAARYVAPAEWLDWNGARPFGEIGG
jgi:hypothetical protein